MGFGPLIVTMFYNKKYIKELEDIIMDELLPMYLVGCRSSGIKPNTNKILSKLLEARSLKEEVPALLDKDFSKLGKSCD